MKDDLFVLGAAAVAVVCCVGVSLLVAAGATTVLGLAGVALPAGGADRDRRLTACYLLHHR